MSPSGDFTGQGINDPTLQVFKDRVGVLVAVERDGLLVELLQLGAPPVELIRPELDLFFRILRVLEETGLDLHGRRRLVHEVVPTGEGGSRWPEGLPREQGRRGPSVLLLTSRSPLPPGGEGCGNTRTEQNNIGSATFLSFFLRPSKQCY